MILLDFNQIIISNLMVDFRKNPDNVDDNLIRHMIMSSIRKYKMKFEDRFGQLVICCDGRDSWRNQIFPYYKIRRKKKKVDDKFDWKMIHATIATVVAEMKVFFPYRVVSIKHVEADDIIASIVQNITDEDHLIVSRDKDFIQLQRFSNVSQYNPIDDVFIEDSNPELSLQKLIITGDSGDDIPNIMSDDDTFAVDTKRQKAMRKNLLEGFLDTDPSKYEEEVYENWKRNKALIDLTQIPDFIVDKIMNTFNKYESPGRTYILKYFQKYRLRNLLSSIGDF